MNSVLHTINGGKRRNRVICMILFLWPVCALSQNKGTTSVVYLKNDLGLTEIHGTLIPATDSNNVAIRTRDKQVWVFSRSEIDKIDRENPVFPAKSHGWYNTTTFGLYFGDDKGYQLQSIIGYRFHSRYYAGLGAAIDQYSIRSLPVFVDFRADLLLQKTTPFVYADIGLTNPWPKKTQYKYNKAPDKNIPGWYVNSGIGWRFRDQEGKHSWQLSIGYSLETMKLQYIESMTTPDPGSPETPKTEQFETYKYNFNRFVIKAGFTL